MSNSETTVPSAKPVLGKRKRNLSFVLTSLLGYEVIVELKNDKEVKGYVEEVTTTMDLVLRQCTMTSVDGSEPEIMDQYLVAGKSIRFVHLPPNVQVAQLASAFMRRTEQSERRNAPNKIHEVHNSNKRK